MQNAFRVMTLMPARPEASRLRASVARTDQRSLSVRATDIVVAGGRRTFGQKLTFGVGALGAALLIPLGILIVGLPVALAARGIIEVVAWLTAWIVG